MAADRQGPFALFGGGGHARAVRDVLDRAGGRVSYVVAAGSEFDDVEIVASDEDGIARALKESMPALLGIGDQQIRRDVAGRLRSAGILLPPLVATSATVSASASIGDATVVMEHAHVGPRAHIGRACVVNTSAIVEHDVDLGDGVFIAPGAILLGHVRCAESVMVGAGAVVLPGRLLDAGAVVAAGAVVRDDVPPSVRVAGVPAQPMGTTASEQP